ncbi:phenylacetate--CoA ligase, partial [Mycobacterium kansasii]
AAAEQLRKQIKDTIGVSVTVDVVEPGGLERSVGKARRLIDNRPKD